MLTGESALGRGWARGERLQGLGRWSGLAALGLGVFALVLLVFGKNPLRAYADIFTHTLGSWYGVSETLVKMIPLVLAAVAVAVPGKIWLINVGGEGQLHLGALFATWGALTSPLAGWLPCRGRHRFLGGGLWAAPG
jgi:simple sugar transport system permease protein